MARRQQGVYKFRLSDEAKFCHFLFYSAHPTIPVATCRLMSMLTLIDPPIPQPQIVANGSHNRTIPIASILNRSLPVAPNEAV